MILFTYKFKHSIKCLKDKIGIFINKNETKKEEADWDVWIDGVNSDVGNSNRRTACSKLKNKIQSGSCFVK